MCFEDDMIEYGFTDGNDLMDEAGGIYEHQHIQETEWEKHEKWFDLDCIESEYKLAKIDGLFYEGNQKAEKEKRWTETIEKWKKDCIIKLWEDENPQKAKLWNAYFQQSTKLNLPSCVFSSSRNFINRYELWEKWLETRCEYEEFKIKASNEWRELKSVVYSNYIIGAAKKHFGFDVVIEPESFNTFKVYNKLNKWIKSNISLWKIDIVPKYISRINEKKINPIDAWLEIYDWRDTFSVWILKNPIQWSLDIKEWTFNTQFMYEWIEENKDIWTELLEKNLSTWEKYYNDFEIQLKSGNEFTILPPNKYIAELEESMLYGEELDWKEYENEVNALKCRYYADYQVLQIWIEEHRKQWRKWNLYHLWKEKYNHDGVFYYEKEDYYNAWSKLYPRQWEKWINQGYNQWVKCRIAVEVWNLWISEGNAVAFDEWAQQNIYNWEELKYLEMENDMAFAYYCTFYENTSHKSSLLSSGSWYDEAYYINACKNRFKDWKNTSHDEWIYWKYAIEDNMMRNKWKDKYNKTKISYEQTYNVAIEIKKLMYLNQIGYNIFSEGLAIIKMNDKFGFFNKFEEVVIPIIYDKVKDFCNGYASVCIEKRHKESEGILDDNELNPLWGIIDKKGKIIAPIIYNSILQITKDYAVVIKDYFKCKILDLSNGNEINLPMYVDVRILDNGMWVACNKENNEDKWALISPVGNITTFKYSYIFNSDNDFAMVVKNAVLSDNNNGYIWGEWGYIDKEGNEVEELKEFDSPYSFQKYWIENH